MTRSHHGSEETVTNSSFIDTVRRQPVVAALTARQRLAGLTVQHSNVAMQTDPIISNQEASLMRNAVDVLTNLRAPQAPQVQRIPQVQRNSIQQRLIREGRTSWHITNDNTPKTPTTKPARFR